MSQHPFRDDDAIVIEPRPPISAKPSGLAGWQIVVVILALVTVGVLGIKVLHDAPPPVAVVSAVPPSSEPAPASLPAAAPVVETPVVPQPVLEMSPQAPAPAQDDIQPAVTSDPPAPVKPVAARPRKSKAVAAKAAPAPGPAPAKAQGANGAVDYPVADAQGRTCVDHVIQAVIEGEKVPVHQKLCLMNGAVKPVAD